MSQDPNKKIARSFQCRDALWTKFEQMAKELECSVDYLINDAMKQYARQRGYGGAAVDREPVAAAAARAAASAARGAATSARRRCRRRRRSQRRHRAAAMPRAAPPPAAAAEARRSAAALPRRRRGGAARRGPPPLAPSRSMPPATRRARAHPGGPEPHHPLPGRSVSRSPRTASSSVAASRRAISPSRIRTSRASTR